jgi:ATP-dependent RNA circularization protein (DNA/RNA ligase family)
MNEYHKIQTLFKRDMERNGKTLLEGQWTLPEFEFLAGNTWVFTEKVDGTNIRVMLNGGTVTFGGKTDSAQIPAQLVTRLNERFLPLAARMQEVFGCDACLYGEGYGAKIQKGGGNYRQDQDFVLFDVKIGDWWLQRADVEDVAQKLGLDVVPIIGEGTLHDAIAAAKAGIASTWGDFQAEGIVARPKTELKTRNGHRIITKIKCRDFVGSNALANVPARTGD